jgi:hypothetical protein
MAESSIEDPGKLRLFTSENKYDNEFNNADRTICQNYRYPEYTLVVVLPIAVTGQPVLRVSPPALPPAIIDQGRAGMTNFFQCPSEPPNIVFA